MYYIFSHLLFDNYLQPYQYKYYATFLGHCTGAGNITSHGLREIG